MGNDLIAPWLTPGELYCVRVATNYDWAWSQVWHGGRVRDKTVASVLAARLCHGFDIECFFTMYGKETVFESLFYMLTPEAYLYYVEKYKYKPGLNKLI